MSSQFLLCIPYTRNFAKMRSQNPSKNLSIEVFFARNTTTSGVFHPKKDLCMVCTRYNKADDQTKLKTENEYQEHLRRKTISLAAKDADKARANSDKIFMSITVDLQAVLQILSGGESIIYYLRKLFFFLLYCI